MLKGIVAILALMVVLPLAADASVINIGGAGSVSTTDGAYGRQGLLSNGEVGTATLSFAITGVDHDILSLTVTNTSPAAFGNESGSIADAPVISDIYFNIPPQISGMQLLSVGGSPTAQSGWDFGYAPGGEPSKGGGFLKKGFDVALLGGPGPGSPDPVISSIYDPNPGDGPGDPVGTSTTFQFRLTFDGGHAPAGFVDAWFSNLSMLGDPKYLAAVKFQSGADGGSGLVTDNGAGGTPIIPEPIEVVSLVWGLSLLGVYQYKMRRRKQKE